MVVATVPLKLRLDLWQRICTPEMTIFATAKQRNAQALLALEEGPMSYALNILWETRRAATFVDKILA